MRIAIVGCGVAGILLCLELLHLEVSPEQIVCIDPHFDGGSLGRSWGTIQSNTTWEQIVHSLEKYPSAKQPLAHFSKKYENTNTCLLSDLSILLLQTFRPFLQQLEIYCESCQSLQETESGWKLILQSKELLVDKVFLCQGGNLKKLDYGKPILDLAISFDKHRVKQYIQPNDIVTVFGTAHSGTIVIKNLEEIGCRVYAVYKGNQPFLFARDNHYDGIKQESADIADYLVNTKPKNVTFVSYQDTGFLFKAIQRSTWIVNATGFEPVSINIQSLQNQQIPYTQYSPETAELYKNLYGFGLAYPGVTTIEGKTFKDVSIPSFIEQICRVLPSILSKNNDS